MNAVDSSVAVASFAPWHPHHATARRALGEGARIVGHAILETYSVLTRLPNTLRAPAPVVGDFLARRFPEPFLVLDAEALRRFQDRLPARGVEGGAVYDALIAATAEAFGATLLTLDRKALRTYERCGASVQVLA